MKKLLSATIILISGITLTNCNKQPAADFTTDKTEYTAGETVKLTNKSVDAKSYKWTFPDDQTSASRDVNYTLSENASAGTYYIKLQAISKKGSKTSEATKAINVIDAMGQVTVWTSNQNTGQVTVKIDNVSLGTITMRYSSVPGCGANGCVTATLKVGTHTVSATDGTLVWNGTVTITKDKCSPFQLS